MVLAWPGISPRLVCGWWRWIAPTARTGAGRASPGPLDADWAARAAQSGRAAGAPKGRDGAVEAIRALMVAKRSARSEQDPQGGTAVPQTADQRCHLRSPARRRPPGRRSLREGPGRATGEPLCLQGGRLPPRAPALRTSHSRASDQPTRHDSAHTGHAAGAAGEQNPANHLTTTTTKRIRSARASGLGQLLWVRRRTGRSARRGWWCRPTIFTCRAGMPAGSGSSRWGGVSRTGQVMAMLLAGLRVVMWIVAPGRCGSV
jgi:hypothetical protein